MARRVVGRTRLAYLCLKSVRICLKTFTKKETEDSQGGALATPPPVASTLKAKFKFAESRRFIKKKFEPTFFAMIDKSWQLFFARAIFACFASTILLF